MAGISSSREEEQIGITVTVLLNDGQIELVDFVKRNVSKAFDERHAWEAEAEARKALVSLIVPLPHPNFFYSAVFVLFGFIFFFF